MTPNTNEETHAGTLRMMGVPVSLSFIDRFWKGIRSGRNKPHTVVMGEPLDWQP
jgi:hypothetical protein